VESPWSPCSGQTTIKHCYSEITWKYSQCKYEVENFASLFTKVLFKYLELRKKWNFMEFRTRIIYLKRCIIFDLFCGLLVLFSLKLLKMDRHSISST
jgi:hypothetical protein